MRISLRLLVRSYLTRPASLELVEHGPKSFEVALFHVPSNLEVITKDCGAGAAPDAQLPGQIREVCHLRRLPLSPLRHSGRSASGPAKNIPQDLTEDIASRHLWRLRVRRHRTSLAAWQRHLHGAALRVDATLLHPLLQLSQYRAEEIAPRFGLVSTVLRRRWRRSPTRRRKLLAPVCRHPGRSGHLTSEYLSQDVAKAAARRTRLLRRSGLSGRPCPHQSRQDRAGEHRQQLLEDV